jgi:hypothetical protein
VTGAGAEATACETPPVVGAALPPAGIANGYGIESDSLAIAACVEEGTALAPGTYLPDESEAIAPGVTAGLAKVECVTGGATAADGGPALVGSGDFVEALDLQPAAVKSATQHDANSVNRFMASCPKGTGMGRRELPCDHRRRPGE